MSNEDKNRLEEILRETESRKKLPNPSEAERSLDFEDSLQEQEPTLRSEGMQSAYTAEAAVTEAFEQRDAVCTEQAGTAAPASTSAIGSFAKQDLQSKDAYEEDAESVAAAGSSVLQTADQEETQSDKKSAVDAIPHRKKKIKRKKFTYVDVLRNLFPWKGDKPLETVRKSVFLLAIVVFSVCLYQASSYYYGLHKSKEIYDDIAAEIGSLAVPVETESGDATPGAINEYLELTDVAKKLLAQNADTVGFISIPGTKVNYPVMQRKSSEDGNDYYLYRNFNLSDSKTGSIFLDYRCVFDDVGEDGYRKSINSNNLIIYGHNMNDTSMFGSLKNYKNNYSYYSENPIILLNSNYKSYTYKIFAVFIIDAEDTSETKYDCWNNLYFDNEESFYDYVNKAKRRALQLNGVDVQYGDQLLTLSTCNGIFDTARLIVMARLVRPGEDPYAGTEICEQNPNVLWPTIYYQWNKNTYDPTADFIPYGPNTEVSTDTESGAASDTDSAAQSSAAE